MITFECPTCQSKISESQRETFLTENGTRITEIYFRCSVCGITWNEMFLVGYYRGYAAAHGWVLSTTGLNWRKILTDLAGQQKLQSKKRNK